MSHFIKASHFRAAIFLLHLLFFTTPAMAFDSQPHVLVLPGHTNSLSAGANGEILVTCDYKTLDGRTPKPGEPCSGEPTLAISVEDLRNLRYISQARDNNELVQRVYEKYDNIVFIASPDFEIDFGNSGYDREVSPVTVRHPKVPEDIYSAYASSAQDALRAGAGYDNDDMLGVTIGPFDYHVAFDTIGDINPLQNKWRPLAEYYLILLPANPAKTTLIHELLHYIVHSTRDGAIVSANRLTEIRKNRGIGRYLVEKVLGDRSGATMDESIRAAYELSNVIYILEGVDDSVTEEIEVNYFISKYRDELGLSKAAEDHKYNYWYFYDYFIEREIKALLAIADGSYFVPYYAQRYVREQLPLKIGDQIRPNYYSNIWLNAQRLAKAYPKHLLGDETNPEPGTMMYQFLRDIGTRAETMR